MKQNVELARNLRKNATPQERKLWNILRNHQFYGLEFRRQYPVGNYIIDFICKSKKLIIEIDGGQHNEDRNIEADVIRTEYLNLKGYRVIRFWNNEVDNNIDGIYKELMRVCEVG